MALVFVQIARHLYQVMIPKVTISTKEEDTYMGSGETGELKNVYWVASQSLVKGSLLRRQNKVEEVVTQWGYWKMSSD